MPVELELRIAPELVDSMEEIRKAVNLHSDIASDSIQHIEILRKSLDARKHPIVFLLKVRVFQTGELVVIEDKTTHYTRPNSVKTCHIIGFGPAGIFAALQCLEQGIKPIVLERGKAVKDRISDISAIHKTLQIDPDSNYCFGEGGAGTYSDGKLYTRSKKRGDIRRILEIFVAHGASEDILVEAHPHIGTNKLPQIVADLRESIRNAGGEVRFDSKVTDFLLQNGQIEGVVVNQVEELQGIGVILATGHSARDIFELCQQKQVFIEAKSFAMGLRVEHSQQLIDSLQYHRPNRGLLPAAAYSLVAQTRYKGIERGVFSFCMCPGGFMVPAATAPGEVVVNGMSPSRRDSKFANSGIVVAVNEPDWQPYRALGALAGLAFQQEVERNAFKATQTQAAPAQRLLDFVQGKISKDLLPVSYQPGLVSVDLGDLLPDTLYQPLKQGFVQFGQKMKGYVSNQAQLIGVESRTSSPVRIPRDRESLEHVQIKRLFPCGEGAGYAGGIMSAAMDGERCAEQLVTLYGGQKG